MSHLVFEQIYPEPSMGPPPRDVKKKPVKKKQVTKTKTGGGGGAAPAKRKPPKQDDSNFKVVALSLTALGIIGLAAIIVIATRVPPPTAEELSCRRLEGENPSTGLLDVNSCAKASCEFDVTLCTEQCPFGFEINENTNCPANCQCASRGMFEGDIGFEERNLQDLLQHYHDPNQDTGLFLSVYQSAAVDVRWGKLDNGRVQIHYRITDEVPAVIVQVIYEVSQLFSQKSCVDLIPLPEKHGPIPPSGIAYVHIQFGKECAVSGGVGRQGDKRHIMTLGFGCEYTGTVTHEFLHVLGFWHEQSRADRDAHIDILYDNIYQGDRHNFQKQEPGSVEDYGFEYDYDSVMHYPSTAFAADGKFSMLKKDGSEIPINEDATDVDWAELNAYYECGDVRGFKTDGEWTEWGVTSSCISVCGSGTKTRFRRCVNSAGEYAFGCKGKAAEVEHCNNEKCKGRYVINGPWSPCDKPCYGGYRFRNIKCDPPGACKRDCYNTPESCNDEFTCEEDAEYDRRGVWTDWGSWTHTCDFRSCKVNQYYRRRGRWCVDSRYVATSECDWSTTYLPADGNYSEKHESGNQQHLEFCECDRYEESNDWTWLPWSECSATCSGTRKRYRCSHSDRRCFRLDETTAETSACGKRSCSPVTRGVLGEGWRSPDRRCMYGVYHTGRFNNDGIEDLLCFYSDGWVRLYFGSERGIYGGLSWEGPTQICRFMFYDGAYASVAVGDVDGDGLEDLLCHHARLARIDVALNKNGEFRNVTDWSGVNTFCHLRHHKVRLIDVNGDGRADLVCGDHRIALKRILLNTIDVSLYQ